MDIPQSGTYRRRPTCIDAVQMTDAALYSNRIEQVEILPAWALEAFDQGRVQTNCFEGEVVGFVVETGGGEVAAPTDDWLARGGEGELYPIRDSVFRATYDLAWPNTKERRP